MQKKNGNEEFVDKIYAEYWTNEQEYVHLSGEVDDSSLTGIGKCLSDYTILSETGRGASGIVYKAQSKLNGSTYALKAINIRHIQRTKRERYLREVRILKSMKHPHILECYGSFVDKEDFYIVTEFAEFGDLDKLIKNQVAKTRRIGEQEVWGILWQAALGLLHMHSHSIIHRDIKTLNILITKGKQVKIGDLGESVFYNKTKLSRGICWN